MRLVSYRVENGHAGWRAGVLIGDRVVDAAAAWEAQLSGDSSGEGWSSVRALLGEGPELLSDLEASVRRLADSPTASSRTHDLNKVVLGPPVPDPEKIVCLGLNYAEHASESQMQAPLAPMLFAKFRNSLIGSGAPVALPGSSEMVDYEGELAVVMGRRCKQITEEEALYYVAGYMPLNDVSARDLQKQTSQWLAGKAVDTFAPCGPALVTADEVPDIQNLQIATRLNGEIVQDANTSMMIFPVARTIAFVSSFMTLEPGDVIATGTPSGVGQSRTPPLFLKEGDVVEVEIEGIGLLSNSVVNEVSAGAASAATSVYTEGGQR